MHRLASILGIGLVGFGITLVGALTLFTTMGLGVDLPFLKQPLVVSPGTIAWNVALPVVIVGAIMLFALGRNPMRIGFAKYVRYCRKRSSKKPFPWSRGIRCARRKIELEFCWQKTML
jgi:hypothetical protein